MRPGQGWAVCSLPRASRTSKNKRGEAVSWVATAAPSNKGAVIYTAPHLSQQIPQGSDPLSRGLDCSGRLFPAHLFLSLSLLTSLAGLFINHPCTGPAAAQ